MLCVLTTLAFSSNICGLSGGDWSDGAFTYRLSEDAASVLLRQGQTCPTEIRLPETVDIPGCERFTVSGLYFEDGKGAFEGCDGLKSIVLAETVSLLGKAAFRDCHFLESLEIPKSVKRIEEKTFMNCGRLESIDLWFGLAFIGESAFAGASVTKIELPDSVEVIHSNAFAGCRKLASMELPRFLKSIKYGTFNGCDVLEKVRLPEELVSIGGSAFRGCAMLKTVDIPKSVNCIGDCAFMECRQLMSVSLSIMLTEIGERAFSGCVSIKSITLPGGLREVGMAAFDGCRGIEFVGYCGASDFTDGKTKVFGGAEKLVVAVIPEYTGEYLADQRVKKSDVLDCVAFDGEVTETPVMTKDQPDEDDRGASLSGRMLATILSTVFVAICIVVGIVALLIWKKCATRRSVAGDCQTDNGGRPTSAV